MEGAAVMGAGRGMDMNSLTVLGGQGGETVK